MSNLLQETGDILLQETADIILLDIPLTYSREDKVALPSVVTNLATTYSGAEETTVSVSDNSRVGLEGSDYLIHQFQVTHTNSTDTIKVTWEGQSTVSSATSSVYIQLYDYTGTIWVTKAIEAATGANTDFTFSISVDDSDYFDGSNTVTARVYQST